MSIRLSPLSNVPRLTISRGLIADIVLAALLFGPLAAPFLAASGLFPFTGIAGIISTMGMYVCPQPAMGVALAGPHIMAVCMRCYGTVLGLLAARILYAVTGGRGWWWLPQYGWPGATLMGLLILAYPFEFALQIARVWSFSNPIVTLFGVITGVALGLFFAPVLYSGTSYQRTGKTTL